jgi:hypothetical protein
MSMHFLPAVPALTWLASAKKHLTTTITLSNLIKKNANPKNREINPAEECWEKSKLTRMTLSNRTRTSSNYCKLMRATSSRVRPKPYCNTIIQLQASINRGEGQLGLARIVPSTTPVSHNRTSVDRTRWSRPTFYTPTAGRLVRSKISARPSSTIIALSNSIPTTSRPFSTEDSHSIKSARSKGPSKITCTPFKFSLATRSVTTTWESA